MNRSRIDLLDIFLLVGSLLALGISVLAAGSMSVIAVANNFLQLLEDAQAAWSIALIFTGMGLLTLPGLYLSYRSIEGRAAKVSRSISPLFFILGLGFPFALGLGEISRQFDLLSFIIEPLAHVIAAVIPMLFMSLLVVRQLPLIPWRRIWGSFTGGLWLSPMIALVVELLAAIPLLLLLFTYVFNEINPRELIEPFASGAPLDESAIRAQLEMLFSQPLLIVTAILFVSVLVPLIEELIKTVALWPMLRRGMSPLYAFTGGVIAGGAYGLFEAFFLVQPGEGWATLMVARAGATIMHMITTGMASLGLALALKTKRWKTGLRYYLYAVLLHGVWNLAALGVGAAYLSQEAGSTSAALDGLDAVVIASGSLLFFLAAGASVGLHAFPRQLLTKEAAQAFQDASAVES
jgi:hypothetical protein